MESFKRNLLCESSNEIANLKMPYFKISIVGYNTLNVACKNEHWKHIQAKWFYKILRYGFLLTRYERCFA